jgi:hypothetical protein
MTTGILIERGQWKAFKACTETDIPQATADLSAVYPSWFAAGLKATFVTDTGSQFRPVPGVTVDLSPWGLNLPMEAQNDGSAVASAG